MVGNCSVVMSVYFEDSARDVSCLCESLSLYIIFLEYLFPILVLIPFVLFTSSQPTTVCLVHCS